MKKSILLLCITCLWSISLSAQEKSIEEQFIKSFKLEQEQKYTEAASVLNQDYQSDNYEQNLRLGWLCYNAKNYNEAVKYYGKAVEIMPYSVEAKLGATLPNAALNQWSEVENLYTEILQIDSKNSKTLYNLGLIYYNQEKYNDAHPLFKELNNLYPTDYDALLMHGWCSLKVGKTREAEVLFNRLLLLYPNDISAKEGLKVLK
jgi:tetratricopeptide (TPR) repeat protein